MNTLELKELKEVAQYREERGASMTVNPKVVLYLISNLEAAADVNTDAAIAEIGAKAVEAEFSRNPDAEIKWDGTDLTVQNVRDGFSFGVTPVFVAANLRAGRKG